MLWKELKKGSYKNYTYYIYGKYTESYPTEIDGKVVYKEAIETSIKIMNPLCEIIHENSWFNMEMTRLDATPYHYLIRFRTVLKYVWYKMSPKIVDVIHIEDDYERVVSDWTNYCEQIIDRELKDFEKEKYEQEMTDGLPDSVFVKYLDR